MKYFERKLLNELKQWMDRPEILIIKGPRQAGKTTVLKMLNDWLVMEKSIPVDDITFLTFEDRDNLARLEENPKEFIRSFLSLNQTISNQTNFTPTASHSATPHQRHYFLLDEIQYVRDCGQKLKLLYDLFPKAKFIVTGSSSLEITNATAKFLVGRMFAFELFPFSFQEFLHAKDKRLAKIYSEKNSQVRKLLHQGEPFDVDKDIFFRDFSTLFQEFMAYGGYPAVIASGTAEEKKMVLKGIYNTYVEKDIISFFKIDDYLRFKKLVVALSSLVGGMIKYESLVTVCESYFKEIIHWLNILEQTYVLRLTRPYHKNIVTELKKNPKVYFVDVGLRNYALDSFSSIYTRPDRGELVENFIYNQLHLSGWEQINFWRTTNKAEVDFVLVKPDTTIPVEVKFNEMKAEEISKSFYSFIDAYAPPYAVIVTKDFWGLKKIKNTLIYFIPAVYF